MDFFINFGILGIALILSGKLNKRKDNQTQKLKNIKILDKISCYMDSDMLININLKYGKLMLIAGIIGALFYNTLGLLMVFITVLIMIFYLINLFISLYKFYSTIK